jgi:putative transposase
MRQSYPTDLNDEQWGLIEPYFPAAKPGGRPRTTDIREVVNAILYILMGGIAWHLLPHDFPKWKTVYDYFRKWRDDGTLKIIHQKLYEWERTAGQSRHSSPSYGVVDSQSVDTATMVHHNVAVDGNKKVKGRKRHIMVDSLGLPLEVVVTAANVADSDGLKLLLERIQKRSLDLSRLFLIYVDGGYKGFELVKWVMDTFGWILEMVLRPQEQKGFVVLPRRWVVERTFGWFYWCRRLSRDYEDLTKTSEAWIYWASIRLLVRRLA